MDHAPMQRYRPVTRLGNWFEDICLEQEKIKAFKGMRDTGNLLVEKTRLLFDNFHKTIELSAPKQNIHFGAIVQLRPMRMNICNSNRSLPPALSVIINERVVKHSQRINQECELTIAPSVRPCVRNSFRIISADGADRSNEALKYGQHFRLQVVESQDDLLLLYSAPKSPNLSNIISTTFDSCKFGEVNLPLGLCSERNVGFDRDIPTAFTEWHCQHIYPSKRFETDMDPLPSNSPLVITHFASNRNLAAENVAIHTLFGSEYLVSVQNYRDSFKREGWQNTWMIYNGQNEAESA